MERMLLILEWETPTSQHQVLIVEKLIEAVSNPSTHRYSQSAGLPKLRECNEVTGTQENTQLNWMSDTEIVTCMGSKEGIAHL